MMDADELWYKQKTNGVILDEFSQGIDYDYIIPEIKNEIEKEVLKILETFEGENFIFNLGHGILPETPIENLELVVGLVKNYKLS